MGEQSEIAILAGGCFWPAQELLRRRDGVISTRVGYTGGENDHPTEHDHRPDLGQDAVGFDYRSEIFCTSAEQRQVAEETIAGVDAAGIWPGKVVTEVSDAGPFWPAEAGDQDYLQCYRDGESSPFQRANRSQA